jgi:two-component system, NtrC family, nitrogen regulation response regulator GlnG
MRTKLLAVNCAQSIVTLINALFLKDEVRVTSVSDVEQGLQFVAANRPNVAIFDMCLDGTSGLEFLRQVKLIDPTLSVIMVGNQTNANEVIKAMQLGAYDYLAKVVDRVDRERFGQIVHKALECNRQNRKVCHPSSLGRSKEARTDEDVMIGSSPRLMEIWKLVGKIANSDPTVLILGESGTGKELLARAIYTHSRRKNESFLVVNCAALHDSLLESELFGHEKGAFTDAYIQRIGKFEQCNGGTIVLDEIGEMSLICQGKLLRIMENQGFERLGGNKTIRCDVRIIACTNQNLEEAIRQKRFRVDLYHRLHVICMNLPPLRERGEDISLLINMFCRRFSLVCGKDLREVTTDACELLMAHHWEGNIRELKNVIYSAVAASTERLLGRENFEPLLGLSNGFHLESTANREEYYNYFVRNLCPRLNRADFNFQRLEVTRGLEKAIIHFALEMCGHNQIQTSHMLGLSRNTLRDRIKCYWGPMRHEKSMDNTAKVSKGRTIQVRADRNAAVANVRGGIALVCSRVNPLTFPKASPE